MPLMKIDSVGDGILVGLWRMTENPESVLVQYPHLAVVVADLHSELRRQERLCVHALVYAMTGRCDLLVGHDAEGTPFLPGYAVSISHTRGFCAVILAQGRLLPLGIDIEYLSRRVEKVKDRFVRKDERAEGLMELLVNWCAKEAAYKFFSGQDLHYDEMFVEQHASEGVTAVNLKTGKEVTVCCEITSEYVLTYIKSMVENSKKIS